MQSGMHPGAAAPASDPQGLRKNRLNDQTMKLPVSLILAGLAAANCGLAGPDMLTARMAHYTISLDDGRVAVIGGHGPDFVALSSIEILNTGQSEFTQVPTPSPMDGGAVIRLEDGTFIFAGSARDLGVAPGYANANLFDPATGQVTALPAMNHARMNATGIQMDDGRVLVAGGWYDATSATYAEVYDPVAQTWTDTGALVSPRSNPVLLPGLDGTVLVLGGYYYYGGENYTSVEVFDPQTNSFSVLSAEIVPGQIGWTAINPNRVTRDIRLADGRLYFLARRTVDAATEYAIVLYDPDTETFELRPISDFVPADNAVYGVTHIGNTLVVMLGRNVGGGANTTFRILRILPDGSDYDLSAALVNSDYYMGSTGMLVSNGTLLITGGTTSIDYYYNFNPVRHTWFVPVDELVPTELHYDGWLWLKMPYAYSFSAQRWIFIWGGIYHTELKTWRTGWLQP
jgi:hypothetical protein